MSALYKRGEYWHVAYHRNGKRVYRTTKVKVSVDPGETIARQVQRDLDSTDAKVTAGIFDHRTPVADAAKAFVAAKQVTARAWALVAEYIQEVGCPLFGAGRQDTGQHPAPAHSSMENQAPGTEEIGLDHQDRAPNPPWYGQPCQRAEVGCPNQHPELAHHRTVGGVPNLLKIHAVSLCR